MDKLQHDIKNTLDELLFVAADQLVVACQERIAALLAQPAYADPRRLERHGFKGYSQQDEDGILQEIFRRIGEGDRRFIEIGVGDGLENNTLYLLYQGWRGLWMDADQERCATIRERFARPIAGGQLALTQAGVNAENINALIADAGFSGLGGNGAGEPDLLSIDIDGNDYHVFDAIMNAGVLSPRVVVIEYNARFRPPLKLVQPYDAMYAWDGSDYFGASLCALHELARRKGYALVATNLTGANAFFVRKDLAGDHFYPDTDPAVLFNPARYRLTPGFDNGHRPNYGHYMPK
ncbi:MAG: hypothetical protein WCR74_13790 [Betaproteobacteria bacterium]